MYSYNTYANRQFIDQIDFLHKTMEEQLALGKTELFSFYPAVTDIAQAVIIMPTMENDGLGYWAHPFFKDGKVYLDPRPFLTKDGTVKNTPERNALIQRGMLEYLWNTAPKEYEHIIPPLCVVLSQWIAATVGSRYDLTPMDLAAVRAVTTLYYLRILLQRIEGNRYDPNDTLVIASRIFNSTANFVPQQALDDILLKPSMDNIMKGPLSGLDDLATAIRETVDTKLGDFKGLTLTQIAAPGSWLGHEALSQAIMAIEHPPTLTLLIARAAGTPMYLNKTRIGRAVNAMPRSMDVGGVVKFVQHAERYE